MLASQQSGGRLHRHLHPIRRTRTQRGDLEATRDPRPARRGDRQGPRRRTRTPRTRIANRDGPTQPTRHPAHRAGPHDQIGYRHRRSTHTNVTVARRSSRNRCSTNARYQHGRAQPHPSEKATHVNASHRARSVRAHHNPSLSSCSSPAPGDQNATAHRHPCQQHPPRARTRSVTDHLITTTAPTRRTTPRCVASTPT